MDPFTTAKDDKNLDQSQKHAFTDEFVTNVGREPTSAADVYILVGRTA